MGSGANFMKGQGMFKDYDIALKWAAQEMYSVAYDAPSINRMRDKPPTGTINEILNGLSSIDRHNQATNIAGKVIGMDDKACSEYLLVKYFLCDHYDSLMINVMSAMAGELKRRPIQDIVMEYCGRKRKNYRELRSDLGVANGRVRDIKDMVFKRMDAIHYRAVNLIDNVLIDAGIVNGSD